MLRTLILTSLSWVLMLVVALIGLLTLVSVVIGFVALAWSLLPVAKVPLSYNLRNLQARWKTTLLTSLAFTLVVGLLSVMLAFVGAMYRLTQESGVPGNVMVLSDGATDEAFSTLKGDPSVSLLPKGIQDLVERDDKGEYLAVKEVYAIVNHLIPHPVPGGRQRRFIQMRGLDKPLIAAKVHNITLKPGGKWWSESGFEQNSKGDSLYQVVLGDGIARTFGLDKGQSSLDLGEILEIGNRKWIVVGIMEPSGSSFGNEIWANDELVKGTYGRKNYNSYVVRTRDEETAKLGTQAIKNNPGTEFSAYTEKEYYERLSQTNMQFLVAFMFIAAIMAIGGVLGVMNTMFAAISQRTKDIGVMRLLGFTRWQILMSFLMESLVIAFVGGLLGCAVGWLLADGYTASSIVSAGQGGGGKSVVLKLIVDLKILGAGMAFALVMGAVGGFIPALSAMRLKPLESLR